MALEPSGSLEQLNHFLGQLNDRLVLMICLDSPIVNRELRMQSLAFRSYEECKRLRDDLENEDKETERQRSREENRAT